VDEVLLVNTLEPFHDFNDYPNCLLQRKGLSWQFGLVGKKVALLAILHDYNDEVVS
jgi:hypothetical protein